MNTIQVTEGQINTVKKILCCSEVGIYLNHTRYTGMYCGYSAELCMFGVYPVILEQPERNLIDCHHKRYVLGASSPAHIFGALREAFSVCFPNELPDRIYDWELFKYNRALYGKPASDKYVDHEAVSNNIMFSREFGGVRDVTKKTILWSKECTVKRYGAAIRLARLSNSAMPESFLYDVKKAAEAMANEDKLDLKALRSYLLEGADATDKNRETECIMQIE